MEFTLIIPVFNRLEEVRELLASAEAMDHPRTTFEFLFVDDGSTDGLTDFLDDYESPSGLQVRYYRQANQGPGAARNNGMAQARGDYYIFLDSDILLPPEYLSTMAACLKERPLDAFGGPDAAHPSFSDVQKAINYAMTSPFTTGGIRGRKKQLDAFQPRSFNMGIARKVYETVGGFSTIHPGEDPDLSLRIKKAGFSVGNYPELYVYHKRRIDFGKFRKQVQKFGMVRNILFKWHPGTMKAVYFLPAVFVLGSAFLVLLSLAWSAWFLLPLGLLALVLFLHALGQTRSLKIAALAVLASFIQLFGYGWGFLRTFVAVILLKKDERKAFPKLFFEKKA
ncbi:MAG TPA: glycosyltransferase [Bacteroidales bacterium]|nr:glycosyltransferase [Bacteroidales bacterium]HRZ76418.1 glycosyltransferase [Bacteroidales bacterium]